MTISSFAEKCRPEWSDLMVGNDLVFGLLRGPADADHAILSEKLRSYTISWMRYGYHGPILEGSAADIMNKALARGYRYCFIHWPGNIVSETWTPKHWGRRDFYDALASWIKSEDFFVEHADQCLLVNLVEYEKLDRPSLDSTEALHQHKRVAPLPSGLTDFILPLHSDRAECNASFASYLNNGIAAYDTRANDNGLTPAQHRFLKSIRRHTDRCRDGVFLWNVESYRDAVERPSGMTGPVSSLYCVAAGFKPNWILHTHTFDANTRVVFFDYSDKALAFRRLLLEEWDGTDYPHFLEHVFRKLPSPETFYHLWDDLRPEDLTAADFQQAWDSELDRWGGAQAFQNHWRSYRLLPHAYVHCDILSQPQQLFAQMGTGSNEVIWWSNAFFTVFSNWFKTLPERKLIYDTWINGLAARNPDLWVYGFDYNNIGLNGIQARDYAERYAREGGDYLNPGKAFRIQIRC
jgi:hypothetical protein